VENRSTAFNFGENVHEFPFWGIWEKSIKPHFVKRIKEKAPFYTIFINIKNVPFQLTNCLSGDALVHIKKMYRDPFVVFLNNTTFNIKAVCKICFTEFYLI